MVSLPSSPKSSSLKILSILFILAIALASAVPNYFTGGWSWKDQAAVPHLEELKQIGETGLTLPGFTNTEQTATKIGGHDWSVQFMRPDAGNPVAEQLSQLSVDTPLVLLLRPQTWHRDLPQVDWMDIKGSQRWATDSYQSLKLDVTTNLPGETPASTPIKARFFRGWNRQQTYAVLQWYAWSNGGDPSPSAWFWVDQMTQLRDHHRMPWVAVSLLIPIKPLGDIETSQSIATSLAQIVQSRLMETALLPT